MAFARIDDALPAPQAYLRAGLLRPEQGPALLALLARNTVGSREHADQLLDRPAVPTSGPRSTTVVDETGEPCAVVSVLSGQFLTKPVLADDSRGEVLGVRRAPNGMPIVHRRASRLIRGRTNPEPVDATAARVVTVDLSVMLAGMDPALFAAEDALFVSAALAIELAVVLGEREQSEMLLPELAYRPWDLSIPVPVDHLVLRMYAHLAGNARLHFAADLDRTDLLCAATAIIYDAPLYTTKPDAYKPLKNGLKLIKYGPVRNKTASRPPASAVPVATPAPQPPLSAPQEAQSFGDPVQAATALRDAYAHGEPFDQNGPGLLKAATGASNALAEAITEILEAAHGDADPAWRIAVLERAEHLAPVLRQATKARASLLTALAQLDSMRTVNPLATRLADAALNAYGHWGRWPEDANPDILADLEDSEDDPRILAWYRVFLTMAGVTSDRADAEMADVAEGRARPSQERVNVLRTTSD